MNEDKYEEREIPLADLKRLIIRHLTKDGKTIPEFQKLIKKELGFYVDQYAMMVAIDELEHEEKAVLAGFDAFYEPDGSQAFMAKYGQPS
ncbi:MAG: hypothetical protein WA103_02460 [Minisyncoccales bacterium]